MPAQVTGKVARAHSHASDDGTKFASSIPLLLQGPCMFGDLFGGQHPIQLF